MCSRYRRRQSGNAKTAEKDFLLKTKKEEKNAFALNNEPQKKEKKERNYINGLFDVSFGFAVKGLEDKRQCTNVSPINNHK